jgi:hypothetical protein
MAHDRMYQCEQSKLFKTNNVKERRWIERDVKGLTSGRDPYLRCKHCHGAVQVHVQQVPEGPADHVEHIRREDSENCLGGSYFRGQHQMSQFPIE